MIASAAIALALLLGRLAARRVLAPLAEVADTAQHIGETEDLASRINVHADDEVGQLAMRFNWMLERLETSRDALDESVRAQRQLVADASHELRTPVTSLRTNIELLMADASLSEEERRRMLADVVEQTEELTALIGDLIELARGDLPAGEAEDVRLDHVVEGSLDRAHRNFPSVRFESSLEPIVVMGVPDRLGRAVNNLLDNAARHSPPDGVVEVSVDRRAASTFATTARASTRTTCRTCSIASTGAPAPAGVREAGSDSQSSARWPSSTAARSPSRTLRTAAPCSRCGSRSPPRTRRATTAPQTTAARQEGGLTIRAWRADRKRLPNSQKSSANSGTITSRIARLGPDRPRRTEP